MGVEEDEELSEIRTVEEEAPEEIPEEAPEPLDEKEEGFGKEAEAEITIPTEEDIVNEITNFLEDDEWVNLASIGLQLSQRRSGFDSRNYGYRNMSMFIKKHEDVFETKKEKAPDNIHNVVYIRKK